ncbi:MAG: 50S ribosomal protein L9 [Candidatus Cloacimonadaceae bacterium]|jgi:large subunit ribosomal protein L9|nr:50S ribosomal protein L9 [Candidatus Cloacimonadota bacterium]MDX9949961.1 50S ribosomal protein L9 [Candidatus Syntrophosphaera sp.]NLN85538.1 50S ribosomal protein L9 [Candidatus Cloacimonadota bacterium]
MKVILLSYIEKLGNKGDVVRVKRGFARNYLIPRNLAIYATPRNMKQLGAIQNQAAEEEAKLVAELKILDGKIRNLKLVFARKVDESDSMFGSVSELDIVNELAAQGIEVHKSAVQLDKHIKDLGEITVPIRLHREIMSELVVTVEKEGGEVPSEPAVVETIVEEEPAPAPETEQEPAAPEVEEPTAEEAADTQENEQVEIQPEQEL